VVYACADPDPAAEGGGALLARAGVQVAAGVEEQRARDLNGRFFHAFSPADGTRPWTELKLAMSLDARIADAHGRSAWITGEEARREVQRIRAGHAAIAIGVETALADNPRLTVRGEVQPRVPPVRVVFDRTLRLPPGSRLVASAREVPVWVVCGPAAAEARIRLEDAGVRVVEAEGLVPALAALRSRGVDSMLCEGGGRLASALLAAGVVDRLSLFYAPLLLGPAGRPGFPELPSPELAEAGRWRHLRSEVLGADTLIVLGR
jgi:diaminohydroxyphosphoribosylaminopyrimidine deaminase/5-amino-6-(5-phosphoribosylamino)uracil reductase